jgi:hypothetical protein
MVEICMVAGCDLDAVDGWWVGEQFRAACARHADAERIADTPLGLSDQPPQLPWGTQRNPSKVPIPTSPAGMAAARLPIQGAQTEYLGWLMFKANAKPDDLRIVVGEEFERLHLLSKWAAGWLIQMLWLYHVESGTFHDLDD